MFTLIFLFFLARMRHVHHTDVYAEFLKKMWLTFGFVLFLVFGQAKHLYAVNAGPACQNEQLTFPSTWIMSNYSKHHSKLVRTKC